MARAAEFTETERMKIRVLHGQGKSARAIAKELGRSPMGISRQAASMGMHFDHAQTAAATQARAIDQRARRARIAERLLGEAEELLDDLKRPYLDHTFGLHSGEFLQHAAMPTPSDKAQLTRAAANLLGEHRRLAEFDAPKDERGINDVDGWLEALTAGAGH